MARTERTSRWLTMLIGCLTLATATLANAQDSDEAKQLEEIAANAQNAGEFDVAIEKWEKLITDHKSFSRIGKAELNCGKCYLEQSDFENAILHFKAATQKLNPQEAVALPESYLFLGYSQYKQGQLYLDSDKEKANQFLTTASKTFEKQLATFKDFKHNDQVAYFQGLSYEGLAGLLQNETGIQTRLEDAAAAYESMFDYKADTDFKFDGLFFLGTVYEQLSLDDKALKNYRAYLDSAKGDPNFTEVQFRTATTLGRLANPDEPQGFIDSLKEAKSLFQTVAQVDGSSFRDSAAYQSALCSQRLGDFKVAADEHRKIADSNSSFALKSALQAGRVLRSLNRMAEAEKYLSQVMNSESVLANEATVQLVLEKLKSQNQEDIEEAYSLAKQRLQQSSNDQPFVPELMLRQAEAALMIDDRKAESPELFFKLYDTFPTHRLAPEALYSTAFAHLELAELQQTDDQKTEELELAKKYCGVFQEEFDDNAFLPDLLEVRADVHLLQGEEEASQQIFEDLVRNYREHSKVDTWRMRVGIVLSMQEKYDETIQWLTPIADDFESNSEKAEAWHWVGKSHLAKKNFEKAEITLQRSVDADLNWKFAGKTLLALSEAQSAMGNDVEAQKTLVELRSRVPATDDTVLVATYRVAETAYAANEFARAAEQYQIILDQAPTSRFAPLSHLGLAWSQLKLNQFAKAEASFTRAMSQAKSNDDMTAEEKAKSKKIVAGALLGRGMIRRLNENTAGAVEDLQRYIDDNPTGDQIVEARYELGLAQIQLNESDNAIQTFASLIKDFGEHRLADRFHYELAWLYSADDQTEKSYEQFGLLADRFSQSELAPEANFKLGERDYNAKKFPEAIEAFQRCLNSQGEDSLREKAAYRLGWSYYKQDNFAKARESFQNQVTTFDGGRYFADALFMIAESHYTENRMQDAFEGFVAAKQAIDEGGKIVEKNVWLTLLHGAISANKSTDGFEQALEFADGLLASQASNDLKREGWLEKGLALKGLRRNEEAITALSEAAKDRGSDIGAKARCMIGDIYMIQQQHDQAIDAYQNVYYGYGGESKDPLVDPWQAYAYYHAALCNFARIQEALDAGDADRADVLASKAEKLYTKLLSVHPDSDYAEQSRKNLKTIEQLKN